MTTPLPRRLACALALTASTFGLASAALAETADADQPETGAGADLEDEVEVRSDAASGCGSNPACALPPAASPPDRLRRARMK